MLLGETIQKKGVNVIVFSSETLAEMVQGGCRFALEVLIKRHDPPLFNFLRGKRLQDAIARELCNQTWLSVTRALDRGQYDRNKGVFQAWLYTVAKNEIPRFVNREQRQSGVGAVSGEPTAQVASPRAMEEAVELKDEIEQAIDSLDQTARRLIEGRLEQDPPKGFKELSEELGLSLSHTHKLYRRALQLVRHHIITTRMQQASDRGRATLMREAFTDLSKEIGALRRTQLPRFSVNGLVGCIKRLRRVLKELGLPLASNVPQCELSTTPPDALARTAEQYKAFLIGAAEQQRDHLSGSSDREGEEENMRRASDYTDEIRTLVKDLRSLGKCERDLTNQYLTSTARQRDLLFDTKVADLCVLTIRLQGYRIPLQDRKLLDQTIERMVRAMERIGLWPKLVAKKGAKRSLVNADEEDLFVIAATFRERILSIMQEAIDARFNSQSLNSIRELVELEDLVIALTEMLNEIEPLDHGHPPYQLVWSLESLKILVKDLQLAGNFPQKQTLVKQGHKHIDQSEQLLVRHDSDGVRPNDLERQVSTNNKFREEYQNLAS